MFYPCVCSCGDSDCSRGFQEKLQRLQTGMKAYLFVATLIGLISCSLAFEYGYCQFTATEYDPSITGYAYFITSDKPGYINMYVNVQGITVNPGIKHGIHVHQFGDISDVATGQSVGSHWDPTNNPHGCPPEDNRHFGDTGNWFVEEDGTINDFKTLDLLELGGGDSIIGRAVVIHNQTDDCVTVASSSTRLAFCVIGVGNPTLYNASQTTNSASNDHPSTPVAVCDLQPIANSGVTGRVWFQQDAKTGEVTVTALVNGITGEHGFHIHQWGDLSQPNNGSSVGGHYNPLNVAHAIPPETVRHIGDMGNIYYSINSTTMAYQYIFDDGSITLSGQNNVIGRGIVVHQNVDDCSQPTGNAGNRYAFCVIGIAADSTVPTGVPEGVPTTQNDSACPSSAYVVRIA